MGAAPYSFYTLLYGLKFIIMKEVIIKDVDWSESKYKTVEWEQSVNITRWEHDFEKGIYIINYNDL